MGGQAPVIAKLSEIIHLSTIEVSKVWNGTCRPPWRPCRPSPGYRQPPGSRPCWQRTRCPSGWCRSPSAPRGCRTRARCSTPPPPPCQHCSRRSSPVGIHNLYIDTVVMNIYTVFLIMCLLVVVKRSEGLYCLLSWERLHSWMCSSRPVHTTLYIEKGPGTSPNWESTVG